MVWLLVLIGLLETVGNVIAAVGTVIMGVFACFHKQFVIGLATVFGLTNFYTMCNYSQGYYLDFSGLSSLKNIMICANYRYKIPESLDLLKMIGNSARGVSLPDDVSSGVNIGTLRLHELDFDKSIFSFLNGVTVSSICVRAIRGFDDISVLDEIGVNLEGLTKFEDTIWGGGARHYMKNVDLLVNATDIFFVNESIENMNDLIGLTKLENISLNSALVMDISSLRRID